MFFGQNGFKINTFNFRQEDHLLSHCIWSDKPLKIILRKATQFLDNREIDDIERYPMRSNPRGIVLIITNIYYNADEKPRLSAKHDEDNLKELFEQMGFVVVTTQNLTGQVCK